VDAARKRICDLPNQQREDAEQIWARYSAGFFCGSDGLAALGRNPGRSVIGRLRTDDIVAVGIDRSI
jgi:hypothetical protein